MKIYVDADACPVISIVEQVAEKYKIEVMLLCDTNHVLNSDYSEIKVIGDGADAVDFALINLCKKNDIVVTQDYGVAAMALGKGAYAIHQSGKWYTDENIDQLLMERHLGKKARRASRKNHLKGPKKRTEEDEVKFCQSFEKLIKSILVQKQIYILFSILLMLCFFISACGKVDKKSVELTSLSENTVDPVLEKDLAEQIEKGYDLPVDVHQKKEGEEDCKKMMEFIREIYVQADKGDASNVVLSDKTITEMQDKLKETNNPVIKTEVYANMENFESVEDFLKECRERVSGSAVVYEIHSEGGIRRVKFIFDGTDMYVFSISAVWDEHNEPAISYVSYTRVKEWKYTDKGWFCYKLCVPEPPEVTEIVDGSCMLRIKPMKNKYRKMSEKCVMGLAYQGNNLLCSNWDTKNMKKIDYNGLYEYLYAMKYRKTFVSENDPDGIPKEEFECLITEYLPITREKIQKYAAFDEKSQTYVWEQLGCSNYAPAYFGTSVPEVTHIKKNEDGTVTLTVDAVCQMILCDDAVITHELTIRFYEDGSFRYLGNKILNDGVNDIPEYQYRINRQ